MSDADDKIAQAANATAPMHVLTITVQRNEQINVSGPIQHELLCLRMLAGAAKAVTEFNVRQQQSRIQVPGMAIPADITGRNGKH